MAESCLSSLPAQKEAFRESLLVWYERSGRKNLPWRDTDDPYRVYVSEIMLQLSALAAAAEEEVLKQWQGLGYYSRARNMHAAAKAAAPRLPDDPDALMKLPGIGRYVAHAVACFGFRRPVPVVDTNVRRVLCRLFAWEEAGDAALWEAAWRLVPPDERAFSYNQALLDVGATVCTARKADCLICPFSAFCLGKRDPLRYPAPKARKAVPLKKIKVMFCEQDGGVLLHKRETAFLGGYYTLPEHGGEDGELLGAVSQTYSHLRLEAEVYRVSDPRVAPSSVRIARERLPSLPVSAIDAKMLALAGVVLADTR
jgi:A/G-specific adenine glycosylase